tara:strand:- start:687 stop:914 length:228 start_codon:yes stop_codon:yes gene_type:complete
MTQATLIYLSATFSFIFLFVGVLAGWMANEKLHEYMYGSQQEETIHPEMFNSDGNWINEELLSVRFLNEDEIEEE